MCAQHAWFNNAVSADQAVLAFQAFQTPSIVHVDQKVPPCFVITYTYFCGRIKGTDGVNVENYNIVQLMKVGMC